MAIARLAVCRALEAVTTGVDLVGARLDDLLRQPAVGRETAPPCIRQNCWPLSGALGGLVLARRRLGGVGGKGGVQRRGVRLDLGEHASRAPRILREELVQPTLGERELWSTQ